MTTIGPFAVCDGWLWCEVLPVGWGWRHGCIASMFVGRVWQCFSAVSDGLTCLAGERPVVDDEQARVAETLKKLHRGDMDIVAYEDEHKFDGDGDEPA